MIRETSTRGAITRAILSARKVDHRLVGRVADNVDKGVGLVKERDININVSGRTYATLKRQGAML